MPRPSHNRRPVQPVSPAPVPGLTLLVALLLLPGIVAAAAPDPEDFKTHIAELEKGPLPEFQPARVQSFVVLCDEENADARMKWVNLVSWAVTRLKKEFFAKDPDGIIDIWLCHDTRSYKRAAWTLFRDEPATPFGYYSPRHRAIVINMELGTGTLVHELVHPYICANFPACPTWFNEGLASLYEQSSERRGRIRGLVNWRLKGLQEAISKKTIPSFEAMMALSPADFYGSNDAKADYSHHYAQARYLCYYLQKHDLLVTYYRELAASIDQDPTGFRTLQRVLKEPDMAAFQGKWEAFVMSLRK